MRGLDYFGGMPIYYSVDDDLCARSTARETYAHIETLLKDAIPALSKKTTLGASEDGYIKQAAAAALLAVSTAPTSWTRPGTAPTVSTTTPRPR